MEATYAIGKRASRGPEQAPKAPPPHRCAVSASATARRPAVQVFPYESLLTRPGARQSR